MGPLGWTSTWCCLGGGQRFQCRKGRENLDGKEKGGECTGAPVGAWRQREIQFLARDLEVWSCFAGEGEGSKCNF